MFLFRNHPQWRQSKIPERGGSLKGPSTRPFAISFHTLSLTTCGKVATNLRLVTTVHPTPVKGGVRESPVKNPQWGHEPSRCLDTSPAMGAFFPASLECRPLGKISLCPGVATEAFFLKHLNAGCAPAQKEHSCLYLQEAFHLHCCSLNAKQQPFLNTAGVGTAVLCLGMASFWGKIRLSHKPTSFMPHLSERGIANFYLNDSS